MRFVGVLLILLAIVSFLLSRPFAQNYIAHQLTGFLKSKYDINAEIKTARFKLPNKLELTEVFIQDEHRDTMIYAQRLKVVYSGYDTDKNELSMQRVDLANGRLYMRKHPEDDLFNFALFIKKFSSDKPVADPKPFNMKVGKIRISDFRYIKHRLACDTGCTNIFLTNTTVNVDNFQLLGDYVSADIEQISYRDDQRFDVHAFSGHAAYQSKHISLRDFYIKTDQSELDGDVQLLYDNPNEIVDFLEKVRISGHFNKSLVSSDEFISYIPQFPQFDNFSFSGIVEGTVNDLKVENAVINLGEKTRFFGNVQLTKPTNVEELHIEASVGKLSTTPAEYRRYVSQFTGEMEWVKYLNQFSSIEYRGKYNGTVSDFSVAGWLKFDENEVVVDARMNGFDNLNTTTYQGRLEAKQLNLKKLYQVDELGFISFNASVKGSGLLADAINAEVKGKVNYADVYGYRYQNINIDGVIQDREFDGNINMKDPNAELDFAGYFDFASDTLITDFKAKITDANLKATGISKQKTSILNVVSDINFRFYKDEWWDGSLKMYDITYASPDRFYFFDTVQVISSIEGEHHHDRFISNLAVLKLNGNYSFPELAQVFQAEYARFNRLSSLKIDKPEVNFTYDLHLINSELITELFLPELFVEPGSYVYGEYAFDKNFFELDVQSDLIAWGKQRFYEVDFRAEESDSIYGLDAKIGSIQYLGQYVDSARFTSRMQFDSLSFTSRGIFRDSIDSYFRLNGVAYDISNEEGSEFSLLVKDGRFNIGDNYFNLIQNNLIRFYDGDIEFQNVGFYDKNSSIVLNGHRSTEDTKVLRISADNLNADLLNYLLRYPQIMFKGLLDGDMVISNSNDRPKFASNLLIDSLYVNNKFLGQASLLSNWELGSGVVNLNASIQKGNLNMFHASGSYYPDSTGFLDFDVKFNRFRLNWIDPLVVGVFENVRGMVSGEIKLSGTANDIKTKGALYLEKAALGVPYFSTDYSFDGETKVLVEDGKLIVPRGTTFKDTKEGTSGALHGEITHINFNDWNFDLSASSTNLLALNTENSAEAYFYGKGYVSGDFKVYGPLEDLSVDVDIATEKGTKFQIPFSNPINVGAHDFITYTGKGDSETIIIDAEKLEDVLKPLGGLDISINAQVTPDARIELVMDETVGDIISGRGMGNLRIEVPHDGDIEMYGTVEVVSGDYLFTMRNIINKKFSIIPGGSLSWDGNPYEANLNMKALYTTRTTLDGMVTSNYDGQRVQVDLLMNLAGPVMNPNIDFKIELPNSQASWQDELDNRLSDQDQLNYQAFSLLLINTFWTETLAAESGYLEQGAGSNTMQMASTQFSNWLAQGVGDFIDISVGYNTATNDQIQDEVEVDISKDFFNDRVTVNSRIDVPVGGASAGATSSQNFTGDIEVVYKITPDGRIRAKAFNRSNQDNPALDKLSPYTQGVGVFYQTSFNTYKELMQKVFGKKEKAAGPEPDQSPDENDETTTSSDAQKPN